MPWLDPSLTGGNNMPSLGRLSPVAPVLAQLLFITAFTLCAFSTLGKRALCFARKSLSLALDDASQVKLLYNHAPKFQVKSSMFLNTVGSRVSLAAFWLAMYESCSKLQLSCNSFAARH